MRRSRSAATAVAAFTTRGAKESLAWLSDRGLVVPYPWQVELALDVADRDVSLTYSHDTDTRFHLNIYPEEWSVFFCYGSRASWIRITDEPFVHGRDDYHLVGEIVELSRIGHLLRELESRHGIEFRRDHALIRTNVTGGKTAVREWLANL
jgi:hypothetical protein